MGSQDDELDDYRWQPDPGDWERLREQAREGAPAWPRSDALALIRDGSKRLGSALTASSEAESKEELRQIAKTDLVLFYRELAENHLQALLEDE